MNNVNANQNPSTFWTAMPYAVGALAVGAGGATLALLGAATAVKTAGIVLGFLGAYAFFATVACGVKYSDDPEEFQRHIDQYLLVSAGWALAEVIHQVVATALQRMIYSCMGR